jgi:hypothetical protein
MIAGIRVASTVAMRAILPIVALTALSGCLQPSDPSTPPAPGTLSLGFTPVAPALSGLTLTRAATVLEDIAVLGDVAPDDRSMISMVNVDLTAAGLSFSFTDLPQGLYSRVRFEVDSLDIEGTWKGVPLRVQIQPEGYADAETNDLFIDLRSPVGQELGPGHDASFPVTIDASTWLVASELDSAVDFDDGIRINNHDNPALRDAILARVMSSCSLGGAAAAPAAAPN